MIEKKIEVDPLKISLPSVYYKTLELILYSYFILLML